VPTKARHAAQRGGLALTASALGLALVVGGVAVGAGWVGSDSPPQSGPEAMEPRQAPADRLLPARAPRAQAPTTAPAAKTDTLPRPARLAEAGPPSRVVVPKLGIDVPVVGIEAPGGVLTPPDDPQVLGWWHAGAVPGARRGSALITGHTVSSGGGALDDLEILERGDRATVRTRHGSIDYRVGRVEIFRKATLAQEAARVFSQQVPGRLVLITCEDWNGTAYESNVVVTARPARPAG
jgi:LPXTG-site transpeptidase (sortase) family protein